MEATIKETVKNIFKTNTFEVALDLTREYRGEYIKVFGAKSWNGLVTYYKKADITSANKVAEEVSEYIPALSDANETSDVKIETDVDLDAIADEVAKIEAQEEMSESQTEDDKIEYMIYRNPGENVEWFGHCVNYFGLQVGNCGRMIRMNNKGVSDGYVAAINRLTLDDVALFHRCYAVIIRMKRSYKEQLDLAVRCLTNLPEAIRGEYQRVPTSDTKLTDYVLNFKN